MPIETFGYIDSLNSSNPPTSDGLVGGDDHIRGLKATLKSTFPNITAAVTATAAQINQLASSVYSFADGGSTTPSIRFTSETTLGFWRSAAGVMSLVGGKLTGEGTCPTGMIADFLNEPPTGWYECNGQAVARTGAAAGLFALYGTFYGVGNGSTTFNLPNLNDRFRRSRGTWTAGLTQNDAIKSLTASVSVSGADHGHGHSFSVGTVGYTVPSVMTAQAQTPTTTGGNFWWGNGGTSTQGPGLSGSISGSGTLSMSGTATYSGDTETRPKSMVVCTCVKA